MPPVTIIRTSKSRTVIAYLRLFTLVPALSSYGVHSENLTEDETWGGFNVG
jgi:hypothetical protein